MTGRKPRVLVILGSIPLLGLELAVIDVGVMLRDAGCDVRFVINKDWGHQAVGPRLEQHGLGYDSVVFFGSVERGIGVRRLLTMARLQLSENLSLARILRRYRPTHVHVASHWDFFNLLPVLLAWRGSLVFHAHNPADVRHPLVRGLWRTIGARSSRFVAVSRYLAAGFERLRLRREPVDVIANRVPQRHRGALPVASRSTESFTFVVVGQVAEHKGVGHAVEAVEALVSAGIDVRLKVLGATDSIWAHSLVERTTQGIAAAHVEFLGYVEDPIPVIQAADAHLMPSQWGEPFGIVIVEAKSCSRPTIAYADGAIPELVKDGVDGILCPVGDKRALAAAMQRYVLDRSLAARHGDAALASLSNPRLAEVPHAWSELYGVPG